MGQYAALIKWIIGIVIVLAIFFAGFFIRGCNHAKQDYKQSNTNQITHEKPREVLYSLQQFKDYQKLADSVARMNNIKIKYLTHYVHLSDTLIIHDTILPDQEYNITDEARVINSVKNCYTLNVLSLLDTNIIELKINEDLHIFSYWHHEITPFIKRVWKWNFGKVNEVKAVNACTGDSVKVIDNIEIKR